MPYEVAGHRFHFHDTVFNPAAADHKLIAETWVENVYQLNLGPGDILVDIGANIGVVSVYAASKGARVIAVEPEPENRALLERNIAENGYGHLITVEALAVSDRPGEACITSWQANSQLAAHGTPVVTVTLAELLDRHDIEDAHLKIDAEGSEYPILAASSIETLQRVRYLAVEFEATTADGFGPFITKICQYGNTHVIGLPDRGGYVYSWRY